MALATFTGGPVSGSRGIRGRILKCFCYLVYLQFIDHVFPAQLVQSKKAQRHNCYEQRPHLHTKANEHQCTKVLKNFSIVAGSLKKKYAKAKRVRQLSYSNNNHSSYQKSRNQTAPTIKESLTGRLHYYVRTTRSDYCVRDPDTGKCESCVRARAVIDLRGHSFKYIPTVHWCHWYESLTVRAR